MKIFRTLIASIGLSTSHFHNTNLLSSQTRSKVEPGPSSDSLLKEVINNHIEIDTTFFKPILFNNHDNIPSIIFSSKKQKLIRYRNPKKINPTRTPQHSQSKHRLR